MTQDLADAFQKTGTTHTVAVSGYNVTIVAAFLMWLGIYLGLWRQQVFSFAVHGNSFVRSHDRRAELGRESGDYGCACHLGDERGETGEFQERDTFCSRCHARDKSLASAL